MSVQNNKAPNKAWTVLGWMGLPGSALLAARLVWEQTYLTWTQGSQMVGYSLTHATPGLFILMLLSSLLAAIFLLVALFLVPLRLRRGQRLPATNTLQIVVLSASLLSLVLPYGFWIRTSVRLAGPGDHAADFLTMLRRQGTGKQ